MLLSDCARAFHVLRVLARHDALVPREYAVPLPARIARAVLGFGARAPLDAPPGVRLAAAFQALGPAYIKLGQVLATRSDIVGDEVAVALAQLQDRLPPFPIAQAQAQIAAAFGKPVEQIFSSLDAPVAAASIAQVHEAWTADIPPRRAAVKIMRPGIEEEFARDIRALALMARGAEYISAEARRLRLMAMVQTLADSTAVELDLRMEAAAASELQDRTKDDVDFRVPHIDWTRTAARVMTSEWIDGVPLRDKEALIAAGHDPRKIALLVVRSFLTQALRDGFFHADMHPGNLFVDSLGRLVAVDFGIMGRLDQRMRRFMAGTLAGFLSRDYHRVAQLHYDVNFVPAQHPVDVFAQALRAIGEPIFGRRARDVSMARLLQQLFDTTRAFDMQAQPQLVLLQKTMMVVEGVARGLDPNFDIWEAAKPVAKHWMNENLGPEARLRDAADALGRGLRNAEAISAMLADGAIKLHPESIALIAADQAARTRHARIAAWIGALAALAILILIACRF
jgi:ubiquinone biosynthesis protein